MRYTEFGGYNVDHRVRALDPGNIIDQSGRYYFNSCSHPPHVGYRPKTLEIQVAQGITALSGKPVISDCDDNTLAITAK